MVIKNRKKIAVTAILATFILLVLATLLNLSTRETDKPGETKVYQRELVYSDRKAVVGDFLGSGDAQIAVYYSKDPFFELETDAKGFMAIYTKKGEEVARTSAEIELGLHPLKIEAVMLDNSGKSYIKLTSATGPHHLESTFFSVGGGMIIQIPCRLRLQSEATSNCSFSNTSVNLDEVVVEDLDNDGNLEVAVTLDGFLPDCESYKCRYAGVVAIYTFDDGVFVEVADKSVFEKLFQSLVKAYPEATLKRSISHWDN